MTAVGALRERVIGMLKEAPEMEGIQVLGAFPSTFRPSPLTKPAVIVGVESIEGKPGGFSDYLGQSEVGEHFGRRMGGTLAIDLVVPVRMTGSVCNDLFELIAEILLIRRGDSPVRTLRCEKIAQDSSMGGLRLTLKGEWEMVLERVPAAEIEIKEIQIRRKPDEDPSNTASGRLFPL